MFPNIFFCSRLMKHRRPAPTKIVNDGSQLEVRPAWIVSWFTAVAIEDLRFVHVLSIMVCSFGYGFIYGLYGFILIRKDRLGTFLGNEQDKQFVWNESLCCDLWGLKSKTDAERQAVWRTIDVLMAHAGTPFRYRDSSSSHMMSTLMAHAKQPEGQSRPSAHLTVSKRHVDTCWHHNHIWLGVELLVPTT